MRIKNNKSILLGIGILVILIGFSFSVNNAFAISSLGITTPSVNGAYVSSPASFSGTAFSNDLNVASIVISTPTINNNATVSNFVTLPITPTDKNFFFTGNFPAEGLYNVTVLATYYDPTASPVLVKLASRLVNVDLTPPSVSITVPANFSNVLPEFNVQGTSSDTGSGVNNVKIKIDSGPYSPTSSTGPTSWQSVLSGLSGGIHIITANATDNAGNTAAWPIIVNVMVPTVSLDMASYLLTDTAFITVTSPASNTNPLSVDLLTVGVNSTSAYPFGTGVQLTETGANTGIFFGSLTFTSGATSGTTIHAAPGDTITVTYAGQLGTALIRSPISFDQSSYQITTQGTLTVTDPTADTNTGVIDSVSAKVISTTDPTGFNVTLAETGVNTGIFTNPVPILFGQGLSSPSNQILQTSVGDTVTAFYSGATATAGITQLDSAGAAASTTPVSLSSPAVVSGGGTTMTITDPGCGTRAGFSTSVRDTMTVTVTPASGTGAGTPITTTLTEGGINSCTFTSNIVYFVTSGSSSQASQQVRVANPVTTATFTCTANCDTGAGLGFATTPTITVYVEASPVTTIGVPLANTGLTCDLNGGDTDNDGVCDNWENGAAGGFVGLSIPNGATTYNYNNGGACSPAINDTSNSANNYDGPNGIKCPNQKHKDIFLELDYMEGYKPSRAALIKVVDAFANAPVQNPDGTKGINLHILLNDDTRFVDPLLPFSVAKGGSFPHGGYEQIKGDFFGTRAEKADPFTSDLIQAKGQVFHYGLFIDNQAAPDNLSSGYGEVGGNDFEISMGPFTTAAGVPGDDNQVAATLMHELGHNLGLHHGGSSIDTQNCKPNYLSVMNYAFQFPSGSVGGIVPNRPLDFSHSQLETLTESALDERIGISRSLPAGLQTVVGGVSSTNTALAKILPWTNNATMGILFDGTNLAALDSANHRIMKLSTTGTFVSPTIGSKGSSATIGSAPQFLYPAGIAYDSTNAKFVVADTANNRVMSLTSGTYNLDKIFANPTTTNAKYLDNPSGVAINGSGFVYVADTGNNRIVVYSPSPDYNYVKTIGSFGSGNSQFNQPMAIAFDNVSPHNNMFVVDSGNNRIQEFSQANNVYTFVTSVGSFGSGTSPVQFNFPWGITRDSSGNLWIADTGNNRVVKLSSALSYLGTVGTFGTGAGSGPTIPLNSPVAIAFDSQGSGYIADAGNNRVSKFTVSTSSFVATYGTYGSGTSPVQFKTGSSTNTISVNYNRVSPATDSQVSQAIHVLGIADCNPDGTSPGASDTTVRKTLTGYDDWDNVSLYFRANPLYANNVFAPIAEISQSDAVAITSEQTNNAPPVANAGGPYTTNVGTPVTLSAAGSTDPENDITSYQWDTNNDGIPDITTPTNTVSATFSTPGDHTINLIVRDAGDLTSLASANVHVIGGQLTVVKKIVNNNGGGLTLPSVTLKIGSTVVTNGTANAELPGTYTVSEITLPGYIGTFSGACDATGHVILSDGDNKICVITNDDQYNYGGILQPINSDGTSIFKLKSTIPVKFQLKNDQGQYITNAVAKLLVTKITNNILGSDVEAVSTGSADSGNQFRYDSSANQYVFNLATNGLSTGTWQLKIAFDDGSFRTINISLK